LRRSGATAGCNGQPQDRYSDCAAIAAEAEQGLKVGQNVAAGVAGWWSGLSCLQWIFRARPAKKPLRSRAASNIWRPWRSRAEMCFRPAAASASRSQALKPPAARAGLIRWEIAECENRVRQEPMMGGLVSRPASLSMHRWESCRSVVAIHQTKRTRRVPFHRRPRPQRSLSSGDFRISTEPYLRF
jgi:hypothetical protein